MNNENIIADANRRGIFAYVILSVITISTRPTIDYFRRLPEFAKGIYWLWSIFVGVHPLMVMNMSPFYLSVLIHFEQMAHNAGINLDPCYLKQYRLWRHRPIIWIYVNHYDDVIMGTIASQITSLASVYSTVYSGADQSKHQSSASLAFMWGIHRGPVNSPHKWPVTRKMSPFDDVIMLTALKPEWKSRNESWIHI